MSAVRDASSIPMTCIYRKARDGMYNVLIVGISDFGDARESSFLDLRMFFEQSLFRGKDVVYRVDVVRDVFFDPENVQDDQLVVFALFGKQGMYTESNINRVLKKYHAEKFTSLLIGMQFSESGLSHQLLFDRKLYPNVINFGNVLTHQQVSGTTFSSSDQKTTLMNFLGSSNTMDRPFHTPGSLKAFASDAAKMPVFLPTSAKQYISDPFTAGKYLYLIFIDAPGVKTEFIKTKRIADSINTLKPTGIPRTLDGFRPAEVDPNELVVFILVSGPTDTFYSKSSVEKILDKFSTYRFKKAVLAAPNPSTLAHFPLRFDKKKYADVANLGVTTTGLESDSVWKAIKAYRDTLAAPEKPSPPSPTPPPTATPPSTETLRKPSSQETETHGTSQPGKVNVTFVIIKDHYDTDIHYQRTKTTGDYLRSHSNVGSFKITTIAHFKAQDIPDDNVVVFVFRGFISSSIYSKSEVERLLDRMSQYKFKKAVMAEPYFRFSAGTLVFDKTPLEFDQEKYSDVTNLGLFYSDEPMDVNDNNANKNLLPLFNKFIGWSPSSSSSSSSSSVPPKPIPSTETLRKPSSQEAETHGTSQPGKVNITFVNVWRREENTFDYSYYGTLSRYLKIHNNVGTTKNLIRTYDETFDPMSVPSDAVVIFVFHSKLHDLYTKQEIQKYLDGFSEYTFKKFFVTMPIYRSENRVWSIVKPEIVLDSKYNDITNLGYYYSDDMAVQDDSADKRISMAFKQAMEKLHISSPVPSPTQRPIPVPRDISPPLATTVVSSSSSSSSSVPPKLVPRGPSRAPAGPPPTQRPLPVPRDIPSTPHTAPVVSSSSSSSFSSSTTQIISGKKINILVVIHSDAVPTFDASIMNPFIEYLQQYPNVGTVTFMQERKVRATVDPSKYQLVILTFLVMGSNSHYTPAVINKSLSEFSYITIKKAVMIYAVSLPSGNINPVTFDNIKHANVSNLGFHYYSAKSNRVVSAKTAFQTDIIQLLNTLASR
jgi:hypothetical protein